MITFTEHSLNIIIFAEHKPCLLSCLYRLWYTPLDSELYVYHLTIIICTIGSLYIQHNLYNWARNQMWSVVKNIYKTVSGTILEKEDTSK